MHNNNPLLIAFLCFSPLFLFSQQKVEISLYLGGNYNQVNAANTISKFDVSDFHAFGTDGNGDSTIIISQVRYIAELGHEFETLPGVELGLRFDFPIKERLSIRTGFGFSSVSYRPNDTFLGRERDYSVDTVFRTTPFVLTTNPVTTSYCDTIIYDPVIVEITQTHDIVFLSIPVNISYEIIEEVLSIQTGLFINTPIYTRERSTSFDIDRTLQSRADGSTYYECISRQGVHTNTTGDRFRDFTFGVNLGFDYHLNSKFSVGVNFSRLFLPFYNETTSTSNFLNQNPSPTRPFLATGAVRFAYTFGKKVAKTDL